MAKRRIELIHVNHLAHRKCSGRFLSHYFGYYSGSYTIP
jgi:hypothetical protein